MKKAMLLVVAWALAHTLAANCAAGQTSDSVRWRHVSTVRGDLPVPNAGTQQTSSIVCDIDGDRNLDIWVAEMRLGGENPDAKNVILLGDGKGGFQTTLVSEGIALHESKIADLDGDGDLDVLGKPYAWKTPRLDVWINQGR